MHIHSRTEFILVENKFREREKNTVCKFRTQSFLLVILLSLEHSWNLISMSAN